MTLVALATLVLACGPEAEPDDDGDPPGALAYDHPYARIYRLDRRVDVVYVEEDGERRECGFLTGRAHDELQSTLDALDPAVDYGYDAAVQDCESSPGAWVHIEGFAHSPFECSWMCCKPELLRAALIFSLVESHFVGIMPLVDGEPYEAIEPDQPCL